VSSLSSSDKRARISQLKILLQATRDLLHSSVVSRKTRYQVHELQVRLQSELSAVENEAEENTDTAAVA
jgi:hypothetical protein